MISGLSWYPVDSGMFISSSRDGVVNVGSFCAALLILLHLQFSETIVSTRSCNEK